ncbi:MAG TPA: hypothetical protein PK002_04475 [Cellvibrio sp.]|nr:hypothetical protein [Cellvibrio sp.]
MSTLSRVFIGLAFIFALGTLAGLNQGDESNAPLEPSNTHSKIKSLERELDDLRKQYTNHLANAADKPPQHSSTIASLSSSTSEASNSSALNIREELIAEVERVKEIFKKDPNFDMDAAQRKIFESEIVDSTWAAPREEAITQAFKNISSLQDKSVKSIQCRSKWCRIEIFYQNTGDTVPMAEDVYAMTRDDKYGELFSRGGEMSVSIKDKVLSIYLKSDPRVLFF